MGHGALVRPKSSIPWGGHAMVGIKSLRFHIAAALVALAAWPASGMGQGAAAPAPAASVRPGVPASADAERAVQEAYKAAKGIKEGKNADYIPYLAKVPSSLFAVVIVTVDGRKFVAGDADHAFPIQSVEKPFTMARLIEQKGAKAVEEKIGANATGPAVQLADRGGGQQGAPGGQPAGQRRRHHHGEPARRAERDRALEPHLRQPQRLRRAAAQAQ
jgi:hypothetical protein